MKSWTKIFPVFIYEWLLRKHGEYLSIGKENYYYDGGTILVKDNKK